MRCIPGARAISDQPSITGTPDTMTENLGPNCAEKTPAIKAPTACPRPKQLAKIIYFNQYIKTQGCQHRPQAFFSP